MTVYFAGLKAQHRGVRAVIEHNLLYAGPQNSILPARCFSTSGRKKAVSAISSGRCRSIGFSGPDIDAELIVIVPACDLLESRACVLKSAHWVMLNTLIAIGSRHQIL